ncbi:hypothetical protein IRP63_13835 (plasmid) [Clostridium botulinum]|uniref:DUF5067 domain-containing protein n=1 Tax=Clostridium botulinum C/D str. DC5 TaxID=1443128 RepID=A0A0A0HYB0_CLOBO|nr:hypothetical protein [Clostridium botulinum]KGM93398.1 hypothetical protein Z955_15650 [Clostridium botulinum C/D str. DC5]KOC56918.1 hypothetical protein ADU89_01620 [Clostridium botulinum]KOC57393.1 hypothetical protein ADU90_06160 [Clostridium botulinum]MCD3232629.1 hypothetical protein [Clostridium botulinum D/C]MCD3238442.1 hypothetical protein [Clostridium botulinum D/C]
MFNKINFKKIVSGVLVAISIFTTGAFTNNTAKAQEQTQVTSNATTIKPDHINRTKHIIPTLPQTKSNERIQFMNCKYVEYDKNTNTYNLVLTDTNNQTDGEWVIPLFKFNYNKQLLQELHNLFYNQISIVTVDTTKNIYEDNAITEFQLLDEQFTGEQMDIQGIYEYIQEDVVNKLHINLNVFDNQLS